MPRPDGFSSTCDAGTGADLRLRRASGVVGGDVACIRAVVHHWTGRAPSRVLKGRPGVLRLSDARNRRDLVLLLEPTTRLEHWPGGPLIWVLPERGPSDPELAQLRLTLSSGATQGTNLVVLVCLPHDLDADAAASDLEIISETLRWGVAPEVEMELEAVWLSGTQEGSLSAWLAALGES